MGFLLAFISYILFSIIWIINFPIVLIQHIRAKGFFIVTNEYWKQHAISVDTFGNHAYRATWNLLFRKEGGYLFGDKRETISSALGKNKRDGTLTKIGFGMCWFLDLLDKDHCLKSINNFIV